MIISRAPLRISLAGGGTDLPSYYIGRGTSWISMAINHFCYSSANYGYADKYLLKYSELESATDIDSIKHRLIRESLKFVDQKERLELTFSADLPGGTGLGSSGAFTVSLLAALFTYNNRHFSAESLARDATKIEMEILGEPIGLQDQFISAIGGITQFYVDKEGNLSWERLAVPKLWESEFQESTLLVFTGRTRVSHEILASQKNRTTKSDKLMLEHLDYVKNSVELIKEMLILRNFENYGRFLDEYWQRKRKTHSRMSSDYVDFIYDVGMKNGAVGGKLIGAGGAGFILFVVESKERLRKAIKDLDLEEIPFSIDNGGATVLLRS